MPFRVIVADCSPSILKAIKMVLPEAEFEIYSFSDGIELEKGLSQIDPDAFIINLSLQKKDGYEISHFLKSQEKYRKIPLILLQGAFDIIDKDKIADLEYEDIIQEPFDSEKLAGKIREILGARDYPQTLPEEPVLDDSPSLDLKESFDEKVVSLVKTEMLKLERKLEGRVIPQIVERIKESADKSKSESKWMKLKSRKRNENGKAK